MPPSFWSIVNLQLTEGQREKQQICVTGCSYWLLATTPGYRYSYWLQLLATGYSYSYWLQQLQQRLTL
jgi:hypothetical protein